jgi:mono/diheme cytochrome c family protein
MRGRITRSFLAGTIAITLAPSLSFAQDVSAIEQRGEALLTAYCSRCHAIGRTGTSPHLDAPLFRALSLRYSIDGLAEALAEGLSVGHPDMPELAFESDEVGAILAYLRSIQER